MTIKLSIGISSSLFMEKKCVVWFRNDLRTHDHEPLTRALENFKKVYPVYCLDSRLFEDTPLGFKRAGNHRVNFLLETLQELQANLRTLGSDLIVLQGKPEEELAKVCKKLGANHLYTSKEVTDEELKTEHLLSEKYESLNIHYFWQATLYHPEDLLFTQDEIPQVFTNFRKKTEKYSSVRSTFPNPKSMPEIDIDLPTDIPTLSSLDYPEIAPDTRNNFPFRGGEQDAILRLNQYIHNTEQIKYYKYTRNGLIGADYSSKFSPWLALGALSPRTIYWEVKRFEKEVKSNISTYWLIFELIWRDYFRFISWKQGNAIFLPGGIKNKRRNYSKDSGIFENWCRGETGVPFVDANMRELLVTGFMSNRGRQNVASFLVHDLNIDWRWGAAWFEHRLIDYDVCSNWGNWNYVAGVGNDPRDNRYFDVLWQAKKYDSKATYIKQWIPELEALSANEAINPSVLQSSTHLDYPWQNASQWYSQKASLRNN